MHQALDPVTQHHIDRVAAGPQHARHLGQDGGLVGREVDHAVRDDDVDRLGRKGDLLDLTLEEVHVRNAGLAGVALRELEHLVRHV